ncbi:cold-shock protein [Azospirillum doebereinerae]|uniref:Cold-shock protein n=1 Tax=Azospirillum doebereinerae TaxID=92933 RepID=A0A3S0XCD2_9PROT|nr:cold-shock protein [Azospirillum doebereinerae]MCG5242729.1 cold-shock protein [Azospirillum doebereinerae]RUQ73647.1 cold-shock protein [Azospirillum doebereinerae]
MTSGTVKWFNTTKGYGFIAPEAGAKDIFVHITAVQRSGLHALAEGQRVEFEVARGDNGKDSAVNISVVE